MSGPVWILKADIGEEDGRIRERQGGNPDTWMGGPQARGEVPARGDRRDANARHGRGTTRTCTSRTEHGHHALSNGTKSRRGRHRSATGRSETTCTGVRGKSIACRALGPAGECVSRQGHSEDRAVAEQIEEGAAFQGSRGLGDTTAGGSSATSPWPPGTGPGRATPTPNETGLVEETIAASRGTITRTTRRSAAGTRGIIKVASCRTCCRVHHRDRPVHGNTVGVVEMIVAAQTWTPLASDGARGAGCGPRRWRRDGAAGPGRASMM